jgi:hypothetical protein
MKLTVVVIALLSSATATLGQTQVQCRPIQQNDFLLPNETIVGSGDNTMVCHTVITAKTQPTQPPRVSEANANANANANATAIPAAGIGTNIKRRVVTPFQVSAGYQYDSVNFSGYGASTSRINANGVFVQGIGNVSRYVSVVGNVDAIYKNESLTVSDFGKPIIVNNQVVGYDTKTMPGHD